MSRDFNGTTDRLDWSSIDNLAGDALTISAWVYFDTSDTNQYIVCMHDSGDTSYGIILNRATTNNINFIRHGTTDYIWYQTLESVAAGSWKHILITSTGGLASGDVALYIDGAGASQAFTNGSGSETAHSGSWSLGGRIYSDTRNLNGRIAEVGVWSAVLDGDTITALASGALPRDYATNLLYYYSGATDTTTAETGGAAATVDGTSFSTSHPLKKYTPAEATQSQTSDAASISFEPAGGATNITPAEATQAQASDAASLKAIYLLTPAEAMQAQSSDAATFGLLYPITPAEATQAQASDAASITVSNPFILDDIVLEWVATTRTIATAEATQAQSSDVATLTAIYPVTPAEATQSQTSDAVTLGQFTPITPAEATQAQVSDAVTLAAIYVITPAEATQTQTSDAAILSGPGEYPITPTEATQAQTSDAVAIAAVYPVAPAEAAQSQTSDAASISFTAPSYSVTPAEATQAQTADATSLDVIYVLTVADATQAQTSDLAVLTSPIVAYPPGNRRLLEPDERATAELEVRANSVFAIRSTLEVDD